MSEYQPLTKAEELDYLDMDDCLVGYWSGYCGEPEPGSSKSKSFWHGWRNGAIDGKHNAPDAASAHLASSLVRRQKSH